MPASMNPNEKAPARLSLPAEVLLWLFLFAAMFRFPSYPVLELDPSWRMALGWFFLQDFQWGRDIVFTYGPLGFLMGNTFWGQQFWWLVGWQAFQCAAFSTLFVGFARRLGGVSRFFYFAFLLLLGVIYVDSLQMIVIAHLAWGLVESVDERRAKGVAWRSVLLAVLATIKFTNLLFAAFAVAVAAGVAIARRRRMEALQPVLWFSTAYCVIWVLCGQDFTGIPAYLFNSLEVSIGYEAMSLPTPDAPFETGLIVAGLLLVYALVYLLSHRDRLRAVASLLVFSAFLFLNWKHGFVRSDGHMIGFFICALVPVAGFPAIMADPESRRWLQRALLVPAGLLCVVGIEQALNGVVRGIAANLQGGIWDRVYNVGHWQSYRASFDDRLRYQRETADMPRTRAVVGDETLDVLGFEQAVALFNKFNYLPRPAFQSYSAYTPRLAAMNLEFYASERAPAYALLRLQTLDDRPLAMDDAPLLNYFLHAYEYVHTEKSWQLWHRRKDAPPAELVAPRRVGTESITFGQPFNLGTRMAEPLWVTIDLRPSAFGSLRSILYKLPIVDLVITDDAGKEETYRMPLRLGRTGFTINPHITNIVDLMHFAGGTPARRVGSFRLEVDEGDRKFFRAKARLGLFALTPSIAGARFFAAQERERYWMFYAVPSAASLYAPISEIVIDGRPALVFHAPSEVEFDLPAGAVRVTGSFGFAPGAYGPGAFTDGAEFSVVWSDGTREIVLFTRYLDPKKNPDDRGLKDFVASLSRTVGGRILLRVNEGPGGDTRWDWTAWTEIRIE